MTLARKFRLAIGMPALLIYAICLSVGSCGTDEGTPSIFDPSAPSGDPPPTTSQPVSVDTEVESVPGLPKPLAYYLAINPVHHRINCGGLAYTDPDGNAWVADAGFYNTGKTYSVSQPIAGTTADALYQTERYDTPSAPEMKYTIPVPAGSYRIRLHFSENYGATSQVGRRVFDVLIEGVVVLDHYDIFALAGARNAIVETIDVAISDGAVTIDFRHVVENPKIAAIEIDSLDSNSSPEIANGAAATMVVGMNSTCDAPANQLVLAAEDPDSDAASLAWSIVTPPASGTASMIGATGGSQVTLCYIPGPFQTASDSLVVRVTDPDGASDTIQVNVTVSGTVPNLAITQPAANTLLVGDSVTLVWTSTGNTAGLTGVRLRLDGGTPVTTNQFTGQYTFMNVPVGPHTAVVQFVGAADMAVPIPAASVHFTTQSAPPAVPIVTITAPTTGTVLSGGDVLVQWAVTGDSLVVDHVHIRIDENSPISSHELAGSYTFANIASGPHTVTAQLAAADHSNFQNPEATATAAFQVQLAAPALSVVPTNLDFGFAAVGVAAAESTLSLQNTGQVPLTISAISVAGAHPTDFAFASPAIPLLIPSGQQRDMGVTFSPSATGNRLASVNITADELAAPLSIPLAGVGYTTSTGGSVLYRINCAGPSYTDPDGNTWSPDTGYFNTGKVSTTSANIAGTELATLYRTERYDSATAPEMVYAFPLANGAYRVKLHFAETYSPLFLAGRRVFDVAAEGAVVLDDLDIFARVGGNTALIETVDVNVSDGALNIEFLHGIENPKINAIEIDELSGGGSLLASPASLQWGHVALGQAGDVRNVQLFNGGSDVAVISALTFHINAGAGHEFRAGLGGTEYVGDHEDVTFPLNVAVGPGQSLIVPVTFAPTEAGQHDISLEFAGNFPMQSVRLIGIGGANPGHPFLHVVITVPDVTVDYDQDGVEPVMLDGADSHTHELGRVLSSFEWREGGQLLSSQISPTLNFGFGEHTVSLTIRDDNSPPESLTDTASFKVVGPNQVPGALALYYPAGGGGAAALLDNVPANAGFAEIVSPLRITASGSLIGGSPYSVNIMARLTAQIDILVNDTYTFVASGGSARRLLIDGAAVTGPVSLPAGRHTIEARFAMSSANDLPLGVTYARGSAAQDDVPAGLLTHDQTAVRPVINSMPTGGNAAGGESVEIKGLGFFPANQVQVNWGAQLLSGAQLTVAPNSIRFMAPPGADTQSVTVQTPNGVSNAASYAYSSTGPAPVVFTLADLVAGINGPTTADWGSDGRLYVGTIDGVIKAYAFDDNYAVTATQTINAIAALANKNILGIAANPLDAAGPVKIYVSHSLIYANGGACFSGSSPYSGQVSVLTGPNFNTVQPLITGLPVSNHDHAINGLQFDDRGDLYICIGGNTNAGVEHCNLGALPESPFTAAIIKAVISKPNFNGAITYLLSASGQANTDQVSGGVVDVAPGVDLSNFASGLRNPYDLVYTTNGRIYATDNGPNGGFGAASTSATTQTSDPTAGDELNLIEQNLYYGHPNRNRGRYDDRQNVYRNSSIASIPGVFNQMLTNFAASTNGIVEYRANTFNGAMRGDLLAQKWNGQTYRVTLSADGRSVLNKQNLPVSMNSLDVVTGPGGVVIGIDYTGNKLSIARPQHTAGLAVYDVFPWRAPESGDGAFVIGGNGFGNLGNTTVTFGGVPATLTSVTATRIRGTIPARFDAPADRLDLVVTVGATSATLPSAFRYLPAQTAAGAGVEANVTVDPGGTIGNSSTYTPGAFEIRNDSTGGKRIARVRFDLSTAILRDLVFDPAGAAGDTAFKVFSPNQQGGTGLVGHAYGRPHDGGFDELLIDFADFDPGETFTFSIDVDPTSIRGAPPGGAQDEGAISGVEMAGTRVTITFSDGSVRSGELFPIAGSATGSFVRIGPGLPAPVNIQVSGAPVSPAIVMGAGRTVRVTGTPGAAVRLVVAEGGLYLTNVPGGGFDLDAYETNKLVAVAHYSATLNAAGHADIPVTLTRLGAGAGFNHVAAVAVDAFGRTSRLSNAPVILLNP